MYSPQSSEFSKFTFSASTPNSNNVLNRKPGSIAKQYEFVTLQAFVDKLQLQKYQYLDNERKEQHLEKFDAVELFSGVQNLAKELATIKIENHFLVEFLEKNDPKLLIGLTERRNIISLRRRLTNVSEERSSSHLSSISSRPARRTTSATVYSSGKSLVAEYHLNYRTKAEMVEKVITEVEKRIQKLEKIARSEIKLLNANMEELRFRSKEANETSGNFILHFLSSQLDIKFIENSSDKLLERKFRKFVNFWIKTANNIMETIRLHLTALQDTCRKLHSDLLTKADLSGVLRPVDFDLINSKRTELLKSLEEKNISLVGLKGAAGQAALRLNQERSSLMTLEQDTKRIKYKIVDTIKAISKLDEETKQAEYEQRNNEIILENLKHHLNLYEAPSVRDYISKKTKLIVMEKHQKLLERKTSILKMKFKNLMSKYKRIK